MKGLKLDSYIFGPGHVCFVKFHLEREVRVVRIELPFMRFIEK